MGTNNTQNNFVVLYFCNVLYICNGLPKLVAQISSHIHHLVNTGLDVGSVVKWLPI